MSRTSLKHADAIEAAAATWIARRDAGLSTEQAADLERWKSSDPRHAAAIMELEVIWSELGRPRRTGAAEAARSEYGVLRRRRRQRKVGVVAAAAAVVLGLGYFLRHWPMRDGTATPGHTIVLVAERRTLPDGSVVDLRDGARIAVNFAALAPGPRRVTLQEGEAHFQVAKDEARPFIVSAGGFEVRAVGTAFSVDHHGQRLEVIVTEGRVTLEPVAGAGRNLASGLVAAGNRIVFDVSTPAAAQPAVLTVSEAELNERLAWRNPRVEFSRAPLSEVVAVVNRYSRVRFAIEDAQLEGITLSGLFRADDGEAFARALERSFGLTADRRSETEIVLRRAP